MKTMLHIIATPRSNESRTLKISDIFIRAFKKSHLDWEIKELNLYTEELPFLSVKKITGKYTLLSGKELPPELQNEWEKIIKYIQRFLAGDAYLLSTPMWNFSLPYKLKQYIDIIVQPKFLFHYTANGVEGLVKNKKIAVIASRGGDYSHPDMHKFDFQEPYLRAIFNFIGITDISFIIAQPMDMGPELQEKKIIEAQKMAIELAINF